jgi:hypothetical protein
MSFDPLNLQNEKLVFKFKLSTNSVHMLNSVRHVELICLWNAHLKHVSRNVFRVYVDFYFTIQIHHN